MNAVVNGLIGLAVSLIAWWVVTRAIVPKIEISDHVSKLPSEDEVTSWRYRVKIRNAKRWWLRDSPAVDVTIEAVLGVRGLRSDRLTTWTLLTIPVSHEDETLGVIIRERVLRLKLHEMDAAQLEPLSDELQSAVADGSVELEDLLEAGDAASVRIFVSASHGYTHARRTVWGTYRGRGSVIEGDFELKGVNVLTGGERPIARSR